MSAALELLRVCTKEGLVLYRAGINVNNGKKAEEGFPQNFNRDNLEAGKTAGDLEMIKHQLVYANLHQANGADPFTAAEKFKCHHQLPGVIVQRGLSTEYAASDATALYIQGHADYQRLTRDRSLTDAFRSNILGAAEVYIFSHIDSRKGQFIEDPRLCGAEAFALDRTDWKDSTTPGREGGEVVYPVVFPNLQVQYMRALRAASEIFDTSEFAREAEKMRKGLQSLFDPEQGNFYLAEDSLGPIKGIGSDGLNAFAYLDLEDLEPSQWEDIIKSSQVLGTVAGYQNIDPKIARTMKDDYHARVWPKENATIHRGATRLQKRAQEEGLHHLVDAFDHVKDVSLRTYAYLDTAPETLKVHGEVVEKAGCDPQLWTVTAKEYFRTVISVESCFKFYFLNPGLGISVTSFSGK